MAKKHQKLNIGLDLDGVVVDHTQGKMKAAKSFGFKVKAKESQSEVLKSLLPLNVYKELQEIIYIKTTGAPPVPLIRETLRKIKKEGKYGFFIISRRKPKGRKIARAWLRKYKVHEIIPKSHVFFVDEEGDKNLQCKKLKIKVYLDDKVKVLNILPAVRWRVFFNPHRVSHNKKYLEIYSWREFPKLLEKIKRA